MLLHWRANLAHQNKRTIHDLSVWNKPLIDTCQYCSTSRANQALHSLGNAGFWNRGVCLQAFPSSPSPSFIILLSFHFALISTSLSQTPDKGWPGCRKRADKLTVWTACDTNTTQSLSFSNDFIFFFTTFFKRYLVRTCGRCRNCKAHSCFVFVLRSFGRKLSQRLGRLFCLWNKNTLGWRKEVEARRY